MEFYIDFDLLKPISELLRMLRDLRKIVFTLKTWLFASKLASFETRHGRKKASLKLPQNLMASCDTCSVHLRISLDFYKRL